MSTAMIRLNLWLSYLIHNCYTLKKKSCFYYKKKIQSNKNIDLSNFINNNLVELVYDVINSIKIYITCSFVSSICSITFCFLLVISFINCCQEDFNLAKF
jgi:hypothetical protein